MPPRSIAQLYSEFSELRGCAGAALIPAIDGLMGADIVADFMHANPSFPTRELTGLHRFNLLSRIAAQDGLRSTLIVYDTTLPLDEAAREGGGFTFKLDGPPYSLLLLDPRSHYFDQKIVAPTVMPSLQEISKIYVSDLLASHKPAHIAITESKLSFYKTVLKTEIHFEVAHLSDLNRELKLRLRKSQRSGLLRQALLGRELGRRKQRRAGADQDRTFVHTSTSDHDISFFLESEDTYISMDAYLFALFTDCPRGHFGNSYGRVTAMNSSIGSTASYLQIGSDGENSIPLPRHLTAVRGRSKKRPFSLLSVCAAAYTAETLGSIVQSYS